MKENKWIIIAITLVVVAIGVAYFLFVAERERQIAINEEPVEPVDLETVVLEDQGLGELEVTLYLYAPTRDGEAKASMRTEEKSVFLTEDSELLARQIVQELLREMPDQTIYTSQGEESIEVQLPKPKLRQLYLLQEGTIVVDFSTETSQAFAGGIIPELAFVESITRSLRKNIPEIERVQFLVGGQERSTLAGHVSIDRPFM